MLLCQCLRGDRIDVVQAEQPGALSLVVLGVVLHHPAVRFDREVNAIGLLVDQSATETCFVQLGIDGQGPFQGA